ncbi:MAG: DNA primase [Acidimicrobiales bacterium]
MGILDEDVAAVRAASDIVGVISQYVQLRRVGQRWQGLCPFHPEKTPSFSVNALEGLWYCFGCQAKGDVITFVREKENLDFVGAVEWLAAKANVTLRYTDRAEGEGRKRRARLLDVMGQAVDWYHHRLLSGTDAGHARRYLRERGLDGDVVREYRLGWAPDDWDQLSRALRLGRQDAEDSGLGFVNRRDRLQDSFRARVMFPIFDAQGDPVSFGGRILPGGERPGNQGKYKNTTETPLYHKSKVLYGLDRAKTGIVSSATAVICEGYTDVIGFHRSGVATAIATCGTALTEEHVKLLRRFDARRMVLAFDADGAGLAAAERFYQWEREHDLEVVVADLPAGQDPGDVAQTDPEQLVVAVEGARPFLRFRLDRAFETADLSSPEGRARAAERALALVAEHPAAMVRDQYLMDVAGRCRIDLERLRSELDALRRGGRGRRGGQGGATGRGPSVAPSSGPAPAGSASGQSSPRPPGGGTPQANGRRSRTAGPAFEVLRHAVHNRSEVQPWLRREVLGDPVHQQMLAALDGAPTAADALAGASPAVADLLARLVVDEPSSEPFEAVRRLLTEVARVELAELPLRAASLADPADVLAESAFLGRCIDELRDVEASVGAADRLLAWLVEKAGDGG